MNDWKSLFSAVVLLRGLNYYEEGAVKELETTKDGFRAVVEGSYDYDVEIEIANGKIGDMQCSCPYAEDGNYCKHMAAVLFAIEEQGDKGSESGQDPAAICLQ